MRLQLRACMKSSVLCVSRDLLHVYYIDKRQNFFKLIASIWYFRCNYIGTDTDTDINIGASLLFNAKLFQKLVRPWPDGSYGLDIAMLYILCDILIIH